VQTTHMTPDVESSTTVQSNSISHVATMRVSQVQRRAQNALDREHCDLNSGVTQSTSLSSCSSSSSLDTNEREQTRQLSLVIQHFMNDGRASRTTARDALWCIAHRRPQRIEYPAGTLIRFAPRTRLLPYYEEDGALCVQT
jgi:hypothetical protein